MNEKTKSRAALGQRQTRQRDQIVRVIRDSQGPLTVTEILERAQQELPGLGVATVYRTLNLLQENGQVQTVILPSGETRYEMSDLGHHHHFHCRICDEVYDMDHCPVSFPAGSSLGEGFVVETHELTLYGTCPGCSDSPGPRPSAAPQG
jgi:Fur family transcriptional regulator, ferric uptake regulator